MWLLYVEFIQFTLACPPHLTTCSWLKYHFPVFIFCNNALCAKFQPIHINLWVNDWFAGESFLHYVFVDGIVLSLLCILKIFGVSMLRSCLCLCRQNIYFLSSRLRNWHMKIIKAKALNLDVWNGYYILYVWHMSVQHIYTHRYGTEKSTHLHIENEEENETIAKGRRTDT